MQDKSKRGAALTCSSPMKPLNSSRLRPSQPPSLLPSEELLLIACV